jgi:phytoene dehydrogenase-like protein
MLIPSTLDGALCTKGRPCCLVVLSVFPYKLPDGRDWRQEKTRAEDLFFSTVESYAPEFSREHPRPLVLSPLDLEEKLGLAGGDIFHGALGLDQLWAARPMLGYGAYRTPLKCLYLCGSGAHPGGGVTGLPGHNAAREILRDGLSKAVSRPNR